MSDGMELTEREFQHLHRGEPVKMRHLSTDIEDIYDTVTPEEAEFIRQRRLIKANEASELQALRSLLTTVRGQEKYQVECMIECWGGPVPTTCSCGAPRMSPAPLCYDCRDKAYG